MARIKVFNKEYLTKELGLPYDCKLIKDDIIDTTRWSIVHEIVFEDKGKFHFILYLHSFLLLITLLNNLVDCPLLLGILLFVF